MIHQIQSFSHLSIHKLKFFVLILALPCLALQCDKDDENNKPKDVTRLSEEFKSYAYFKEGSWWVYKELNSGNLDSAYIIRSDILEEFLPQKSGGPANLEHLSITMVRNIYNERQDTIIIEGYPMYNSNNNDDLYNGERICRLIRTIYRHGVSSNLLLYTPVSTNYKINENGVYIRKTLDSITIQGKTYHDVFITKHPGRQGGETNELIKSDYYAKNVGLIKRIYWDGRVKELLRYNVKQ